MFYISIYIISSKFDQFIIVTKYNIFIFIKAMIFFSCFFKEQIKVLEVKVRKASALRGLFVRILDYLKNAINFLGGKISMN